MTRRPCLPTTDGRPPGAAVFMWEVRWREAQRLAISRVTRWE